MPAPTPNKYPDIAIKAMINAIDDDEDAYKWLGESKYKELAAFVDVWTSDNTEALQFLLSNKTKFITIVNFIAALQEEDKAFNELMLNDKNWAAVVSSVHGHDEAYEWLKKNNFSIFVELADMLIQKSVNSSSGISGYSGGGGSFGGGGGFGGFGGGSFGGGGTGGRW